MVVVNCYKRKNVGVCIKLIRSQGASHHPYPLSYPQGIGILGYWARCMHKVQRLDGYGHEEVSSLPMIA